jgi:hypothetical protein
MIMQKRIKANATEVIERKGFKALAYPWVWGITISIHT